MRSSWEAPRQIEGSRGQLPERGERRRGDKGKRKLGAGRASQQRGSSSKRQGAGRGKDMMLSDADADSGDEGSDRRQPMAKR